MPKITMGVKWKYVPKFCYISQKNKFLENEVFFLILSGTQDMFKSQVKQSNKNVIW